MHKKEEFVQVIKKNKGIIFKISKLYAADNEDQKDLYQEIVYQLWKSFGSFRGESKMSTWIYRIVLNTSIAYLNKRKNNGTKVPIDFELLNLADDHDPVMEERVNILYESIKMLNNIDKGIILLFLEGKTYDEISAITGFTSTNVGTRLMRIKQVLKSQIIN